MALSEWKRARALAAEAESCGIRGIDEDAKAPGPIGSQIDANTAVRHRGAMIAEGELDVELAGHRRRELEWPCGRRRTEFGERQRAVEPRRLHGNRGLKRTKVRARGISH